MTERWIVRLPTDQRPSLARCRLIPGLEVADGTGEAAATRAAEATDSVWVRGPELKEAQQRMLRAIPRAEWFELDAEGRLRPEGKRLATGPIPRLAWRPILEAVPVSLPHAGFAGTPLRPSNLKLVRSSEPRTPNLLLTTPDEWSRYGETAPQIRLAAWRFASDGAGRILVRGLPLPPLPGSLFVEENGMAIPAGWSFIPPLPSTVVREILAIPRGDIALFAPDGTWEQVAEDDFVPAARAAVRPTTARETGP